MNAPRRQGGTTTVEFAVAGASALLVVLGCLEVGRLVFALNTLAEATRRAARVAVVCPMNDPEIARAALFSPPDDGRSRVLAGLVTGNVQVDYMDEDGAAATMAADVRFVRVAISDYQHELIIPWVGRTLTAPSFATSLPTESLGYVPELSSSVCFSA